MNYIYVPSQKDIDQATDFAESHYQNHIRGSRSIEKVKENIILGKLGEIAFKRLKEDEVNEIDWSGIPQGIGEDFHYIGSGKKVQIKTINEETKWGTFYNWNFDELVLFRSIGNEIHLIRTYDKNHMKTIAKQSKYKGWYFYP